VGHSRWGAENEKKGRRKKKVTKVNGIKLVMPKANRKVIGM